MAKGYDYGLSGAIRAQAVSKIRQGITKTAPGPEERYHSYLQALLGNPNVDLSKPGAYTAIHKAARTFSGMDEANAPPQPTTTSPHLNYLGKMVSAPLPAAAYTDPNRWAGVQAARAAQNEAIARQRDYDAGQTAVREGQRKAGLPTGGTIRNPQTGVVETEEMFEARQAAKRNPPARLPQEEQVNKTREAGQARAEEISAQLAKNATMRDALRQRQAKGPYDQIAAGEVADLDKQADELRAEEHRMRVAATTPTPQGVRPGDRPTSQAQEYTNESLPLIRARDAWNKQASGLYEQMRGEKDSKKYAALLTKFRNAVSKASILDRQIAAAPQAPEPRALAAEQAEVQTNVAARKPLYREQSQAGILAVQTGAQARQFLQEGQVAAEEATPGIPMRQTGADQLASIKARAAEAYMKDPNNKAAARFLGIDKMDEGQKAALSAALRKYYSATETMSDGKGGTIQVGGASAEERAATLAEIERIAPEVGAALRGGESGTVMPGVGGALESATPEEVDAALDEANNNLEAAEAILNKKGKTGKV